MSTFRGVMPEFPDIRVDFFRLIPGLSPPRACFLSHVHSDHLAGLESLKSPFVYCSPATREILLRLEKYPHRVNFERGVLESRKVTYKHLKDRLKTIPLETPTQIELMPGNEIQVTLFDANHCTGAVMFLIEGDDKAVLYTGDIRSEPWFVNNLTRNPFLIEYTSGLKSLDCIYLDTSNIHSIPFPTKADGLKELLQKVSKYPQDTVFHFTAWTFGYEEVWMALSRALKSQIHVDNYKLRLYQSLRGNPKDNNHLAGPFLAHEGPTLTGYQCGNTPQAGCLTSDSTVRLHSCEKGLHCQSLNDKTVWIRPIITRTKHGEIAELGVGGGGGDLTRRPELEVDSNYAIDQFLGLFANTEDLVMVDIKRMLCNSLRSGALSLDDMGLEQEQDDMPLTELIEILARAVSKKHSTSLSESPKDKDQGEALPSVITFPYSRHSSYAELCHLVKAFNPRDVYPCTVDEENWDEDVSMKTLFGDECSAARFRHDDKMRELHPDRHSYLVSQQSQTTSNGESSQMQPPTSPVQPDATTPKRSGVIFQRNSKSRERLLDEGSTEVIPASVPSNALNSTPPREVLAISPGSESQSLRRKVILDDLGERQVKRARISYNGPDLSQSANSNSQIQSTPGNPAREFNLPAGLEWSEESDHAHTPGSDADDSEMEEQTRELSYQNTFSAFLDSDGKEIQFENGEPDPYPSYPRDIPDDESTVYDCEDQVSRCKLCGHEVWSGYMGFCTGCKDGPDGVPYFEVLEPDAGPRPNVLLNEHACIIDPEDRRNIVGDYLDDYSSAYDTQDEQEAFHEDYEINSFIDDDSSEEPESDHEDNASSCDGEMDYKQLYEDLVSRYDNLSSAYCNLEDEHEEFRRDILGPGYDSSNDDDDEVDENGMRVIDVNVPDPVVAELILSHAQEQSQESEISPDRIRNRVEASEAAVDGQGWHNISLVSAGDNHTNEEIEL